MRSPSVLAAITLPAVLACGTGTTAPATQASDGGGDASAEAPLILASGLRYPGPIAARDGFVYWIDADGSLMKASSTGSGPAVVGTGCNATALAVDAANAYCAGTDMSLRAFPLTGGGATVLASAEPAADLASDGARLYFTTYYGVRIAGGNDVSLVGAIPLDGGAIQTLATRQLVPASIVVDATYAYWTVAAIDATGTTCPCGAVVIRAPLGGGGPTALGSTDKTIGDNKSIAVNASGIYIGTEDALLELPITGGSPEVLASASQASTGAIALNDEAVYWAGADGVMKVPLAGGAAIALAPGVHPSSLAADASYVYWTDSAMGTVSRVNK
jgi:hypothetical protein